MPLGVAHFNGHFMCIKNSGCEWEFVILRKL